MKSELITLVDGSRLVLHSPYGVHELMSREGHELPLSSAVVHAFPATDADREKHPRCYVPEGALLEVHTLRLQVFLWKALALEAGARAP